MPRWEPQLVNQFRQDDIYVEMTFLRTLELYGFDVSIRQAGIDFANSGYPLWHANRAGRDNLRAGIAPPDSGHPEYNQHADDIDYQIESDYAGLIAPGMPNVVIELGENVRAADELRRWTLRRPVRRRHVRRGVLREATWSRSSKPACSAFRRTASIYRVHQRRAPLVPALPRGLDQDVAVDQRASTSSTRSTAVSRAPSRAVTSTSTPRSTAPTS